MFDSSRRSLIPSIFFSCTKLAIFSNKLANAIISSTAANTLGKVCYEHLSIDKNSFVEQPHILLYQEQNIKLRSKRPTLRVALLGQSNLQLVGKSTQKNLEKMINDQNVEVYTPPFGQSFQMVMNKNSNLWDFNPDYIFFLDRLEDVYGQKLVRDVNNSNNEKLLQYINVIKKASLYTRGSVYVAGITYSGSCVFDNTNQTNRDNANFEIINKQLFPTIVFPPPPAVPGLIVTYSLMILFSPISRLLLSPLNFKS